MDRGKGQPHSIASSEGSALSFAPNIAVDAYAERAIYDMTSSQLLATLDAVHRESPSRRVMGHANDLGFLVIMIFNPPHCLPLGTGRSES